MPPHHLLFHISTGLCAIHLDALLQRLERLLASGLDDAAKDELRDEFPVCGDLPLGRDALVDEWVVVLPSRR